MSRAKALKPTDMTPAQLDCYRLWCDFRGGEHHVIEHVTGWSEGIRCVMSGPGYGFATTDDWNLTALVVLAHDRAIRVEMMAVPGSKLAVALHKRKREGKWYERHPDLETSAKRIRESISKRGPCRVYGVDR